jgi:hypothetical protein
MKGNIFKSTLLRGVCTIFLSILAFSCQKGDELVGPYSAGNNVKKVSIKAPNLINQDVTA